jgi:dGTPase
LNLTRATLRAILKYPWPRGETGKRARKWGAYASESNDFRFAMELAPRPETRSLEAEIMDWADDIAYAIHDVEDFYRAGIIPLDRLATDHRERERFLGRALARQRGDDEFTSEELRARFEGIMAVFPLTEPYAGNHEHRARLRSFTSWLIDRYVRATSLARDGNAASALSIIPTAKMEVAVLKALTWHYVIQSPALISQRYGQRQLISSLFGILFEAAQSPRDRRVFPEFYREQIGDAPDDATIVRTVADLISSMTESQVVEMHHRLTGISLGGALDPIVS